MKNDKYTEEDLYEDEIDLDEQQEEEYLEEERNHNKSGIPFWILSAAIHFILIAALVLFVIEGNKKVQDQVIVTSTIIEEEVEEEEEKVEEQPVQEEEVIKAEAPKLKVVGKIDLEKKPKKKKEKGHRPGKLLSDLPPGGTDASGSSDRG